MTDVAARPIHVTGLFPELLGIGGVQEVGRLTALAIHQIAERLAWSADFSGLNDPPGPQQLSVAGCTINFTGFSRAKMQFIRAAIRSGRTKAGKAQHIVVAGHPNLAPIAAWIQMASTARAIVIAHGIEVWQPLAPLRRGAVRSVHMVTAPSSDTIEKLVDVQRVAQQRLRLLAWPLSPDFLRLTERANLPKLPGFPNGKVILTIGRAAASERYKGTDDLISAVAALESEFPNLHLVVVGGGDDLPRLEKLANEAGAAQRVHFFQRLSQEELASCYASADIFAMPSSGEGFGLVFLEAMAFQKPVIAAACGGALDLVRDGFNGLLVAPHAPAALRDAFRRLLHNEALRSTLGANGRAAVHAKYRFDSFASRLETLLDECLVQ